MLKLKLKYWVFFLLIFVILVSCEEVPVDQVNYVREISNFINNSLDGKELYSNDLYPEEAPFAMDESADLYFYRVENVSRMISVDSLDLYEPSKIIYPFSYTRDAVAVINDDFTGNIYRIRGTDTTLAYKFESALQRYAYFIKQFGDSYQFHGWRFWAYSGLNYSIDGAFVSDSGLSFNAIPVAAASLPNYRLGRYYIVEDFIAKLPLGDSITFSSNYKERIFYRDQSDTLKAFNTILDEGTYKTGWQIPAASDVFFQLITFDSDESGYYFKVDTLSGSGESIVVESTLVKRGDYVIPFKVDI
ncbi:MAG: hypothetical protein GY865_04945 [candidate division Zixibacteria bacterium]|nr:hypothetical protein [candidate division Zixibacteria bacterium]